MVPGWVSYFETFGGELGEFANGELRQFLQDGLNDANIFLREQIVILERYLEQLAAGEITKEEFKGYVVDLHQNIMTHELVMKLAAKERAHRMAERIEQLILERLVNLLS